MSSTIEYRHVAVILDRDAGLNCIQQLLPIPSLEIDECTRSLRGGQVPLVFVESGSSNTFEASGRRARNWNLDHFGQCALEYAIRTSCFAESGGTKLLNRDVKAESYIRHYRKLIGNAPQATSAVAKLPYLVFRLADRLFHPVEGDKYTHKAVARDPFTQYLRDSGHLVEHVEKGFLGMKDHTFMELRVPEDDTTWMAAMTWLTIHCEVPDRKFDRYLWLRPHCCPELETWLYSFELDGMVKKVAS